MDGISVLLIERSMGGVSTRRMDCQGVHSSGTTYVTFEDVKVPVENLIGKENKGFRVIMTNFNHERIGICIQAIRFARVCYEESVKYSNKRGTFLTGVGTIICPNPAENHLLTVALHNVHD